MKSNLKRWYFALATVNLVVSLLVASTSQVHAGNHDPKVIPPHVLPFGMNYAEWSARWWQWAYSLPVDKNPFYDQEGQCDNGANGQLGPVWFLTGVFNESGTAVRNCTVPAGKALFFPLINVECSTVEGPPFHGDNEAQLRSCAKSFRIENAFARVDGVKVRDLNRYLVTSPLFTFSLPKTNVLGIDYCKKPEPPQPEIPQLGQSVSNGYYLMLAPLSVGKHTIRFGGSFPDFALDITYNLTVIPARR